MKKSDNKCTIVANSLILSDLVCVFLNKYLRILKIARFIIFYYLTYQVDLKKNKKNFPAYDNDSNANFENLLKQEITNLAIFLFFQVFKTLFSSI